MHVKEILLGPRDEFAAKTWIRDFDQGFDSLGDTLAVEFCNAVFGDDSIHICSRGHDTCARGEFRDNP